MNNIKNQTIGALMYIGIPFIFWITMYLIFVNTIIEDLIESPHHRITKLEIERCNNLYKQYKEVK